MLGGLVALAAILVAVLVASSSPDKTKTPVVAAGEAVPGQAATAALLNGIPQRGRALGATTAPVTLVEFADLQCPFCKQYAIDALPAIVRDYVRTGKVRLEFRPRTFLGPDSVVAARRVVAAGRQGKLWNVLDLLYANQGAEGSGWATEALLDRVVKAAGADPVRVAATARTSPGVTGDLRAADALAARYALDSTPAFLVGRTGGELAPLRVQALTAAAFSAALDQAAKQ